MSACAVQQSSSLMALVSDICNGSDNENVFITIDLHVNKIQDARYEYTEKEHQTLFFLW